MVTSVDRLRRVTHVRNCPNRGQNKSKKSGRPPDEATGT